jgi:lysine-N-methylase
MTLSVTEKAIERLALRREIAAVMAAVPRIRATEPTPAMPHLDLPQLPPMWPAIPAPDYARPTYAGKFQCIGSECEDNCCKGWSVPVDRASYEKYQHTPGLKRHVGTLVVLNTENPTTADYARIPLTAQAECGFLDEDKMCGMQRTYGHAMLSDTCATYPRAVANNMGQEEKALNLSYSMVTRRRPVAAAWLRSDDKARRLGQRLGEFDPRLAIREFALLLLGDRRYPLWQRLYLLGNLARRLQAAPVGMGRMSVGAWCEAYPGKVSKLLQESATDAASGSLRPLMDEIKMRPDQQIQLLLEVLRVRFKEPPVPLRFLECVQDFQLGLGTATADNEETILDAYRESYRRYYRPFMDRHPQLMENFLTNLVFKNNYPFGKDSQPGGRAATTWKAESEHLALCAHAALAQTLLIGMAAHYKEAFDTTHVVKLVQSLAKTLEHSSRSIEQIGEFVRAQQLNNPEGIALLLGQEDGMEPADTNLNQNAMALAC